MKQCFKIIQSQNAETTLKNVLIKKFKSNSGRGTKHIKRKKTRKYFWNRNRTGTEPNHCFTVKRKNDKLENQEKNWTSLLLSKLKGVRLVFKRDRPIDRLMPYHIVVFSKSAPRRVAKNFQTDVYSLQNRKPWGNQNKPKWVSLQSARQMDMK